MNDLDSGAIVSAQVLPGDLANGQEIAERVLKAVSLLPTVTGTPLESLVLEVAADEGYFSAQQVGILPACAIRTMIVDPHRKRGARPLLARYERLWPGRAGPCKAKADRGCYANAENIWNEASVTCSIMEACGGRPCVDAKT